MKIDVLTLFPAMFAGPLDESIIKRARQAGLLELQLHQLRDWTHDRHKTVDDRPFGGSDPSRAAFFHSPDCSGEHPSGS